MDNAIFVLLDDCNATAQQPTSRLYTDFVREHRCTDPHALDTLWTAVAQDQQLGLHATVFADYEWGCKLQGAGCDAIASNDASALRVLMFRSLQCLSAQAVSQWLAAYEDSEAPSPAGFLGLRCTTDAPRFDADIAHIRDLIGRGETYQVNYTQRMHGQQFGSPVGLYRRLQAMQPVPFGALAALPAALAAPENNASEWVVSLSPELFVRHHAGRLIARPMKGTAARHSDAAADLQQAQWLQNDAKNRAENVMIVDLLRNDLSKISTTGSVRVPSLFNIETYRTVHQMTSTVESTVRSDATFANVLRALFPCGSITGAPKLHAMDWIGKIEESPRGLYCGAIGWVDAPSPSPSPSLRPPATATATSIGNFCLSVAIRTLSLGNSKDGMRPVSFGVGSGIVWDSVASVERTEARTKARFVTQMDPGFTLFETMRLEFGRIPHLALHLQRLQHSALELGFAWNEAALLQTLLQQIAALPIKQRWRLRLDLHHDGSCKVQHSALAPLPPGPALLVLAAAPLPSDEQVLLRFKTSMRSGYDAAIQKAIAHGAFDTVFINACGDVTEGARSTLLVKSQGKWYTPPLSSGVLQGVMRTRLLCRYAKLTERAMPLSEVMNAEQLLVCSALRGVQHAHWMQDALGDVVRV